MRPHDPSRYQTPRPQRRDHRPQRPLTDAQRDQVARHLPLVHLQMRRQPGVRRPSVIDRDPDDLFQEGCLALAHAVRTHDPSRHGSFAAFALARIHHALSRALYEQDGGIRVPMTTRRRRDKAADKDRHRPDDVPRQVSGDVEARDAQSREPHSGKASNPAAPILAHLARERYERNAHRAAAELAGRRTGPGNPAKLLACCLEERWLVSQPESRTSLRALAGRLGCSLGRVTHWETVFKRRVARLLSQDAAARWLAERAREHPAGFARLLDPEEVEQYRVLAGAGQEHCVASPRGREEAGDSDLAEAL